MSHSNVDGIVDIIKISMVPISVVKDENTTNSNVMNESSNDVNSNPLHKLDKLIQNFKDSFINETSEEHKNEVEVLSSKNCIDNIFISEFPHKSENESIQNNPESNSFENENGIMIQNEPEGCILEHKSINSSQSSDTLELTQNFYRFQSVFKSFNEMSNETKIFEGVNKTVHHSTATEKLETNGTDNTNEYTNPFETLCQLLQEEDFNCSKNIPKPTIDKLPETSSTEDTDEKNSTYTTVDSNKTQANDLDYTQGTTLQNDLSFLNLEGTSISDQDREKASERNCFSTERVFILEGDVEVDIHDAIRRDDEFLLKQLLARGADPDEPDWRRRGDPPIVQAALKQNVSIVKALCLAGCDVNLTSVRGETALHMAVSRRPVCLPLLDALLTAGCNPNTQDKLRGCSALHCVSGFADDEPQVFLKLVAITNVNLRDHRHSTVLHRVAASSNNVTWIKQLLELGADPSVQNDRGETALCVALERGWEAGALALVAGGTDLHHTNLYRETALHIAARHNQASVVAALLRQCAEVNSQDLAGNTALHLAAGRGYVNTVRQLLTCPNLNLETHNCEEATPLTCAVESGFISVVQMLVEAEEVDLEPALDVAKQSYRRLSQPEMCQLLTRELARRQTPHLT
ncbi:death-associated protein kinase 1-like [Macrosteles quadrilineatus]|uniref:death-associated protein kinase 1-like n=1 Tax=Macrosteles quadrilineatus TaxID=74068 RepID=UPI0023E16C77|nr:death-associated protein kinase 1-like [Macrosteles quadrilineatus]